MYNNGQGAPKDSQKAVEFYLNSANQGNEAAQYNLGTHPLHSNLNGIAHFANRLYV